MNIDPVIVAWTVMQSTFLGFAIANWMTAREDIAMADGDDEAARPARAREKRQIVRVIGFAALTTVGLGFIFSLGREQTSLIMIVGLYSGSIALGSEDIIERRERRKFVSSAMSSAPQQQTSTDGE